MKKLHTGLILLLAFVFNAAAQSSDRPYLAKPRLSVGPEIAMPGGSYGDNFSIGFGGSLKGEVPVTREFYLTATAGFTVFYLNEDASDDLTINKRYVPLKAGIKYYLIPFLYAEGEFGISLGTNKNAGSALVWSPGAGFSIPISKDGYLDAGFRYERWARENGNIEQGAIRVAYKF